MIKVNDRTIAVESKRGIWIIKSRIVELRVVIWEKHFNYQDNHVPD